MSRAEPRKLFGRPSAALLDEAALPGVPPLIRVEPPRASSVSAASPMEAQHVRSIASLPDELDDPDEFEEEDTAQDVRSGDDEYDAAWGAAFEVDDFRAARREDPDADLRTGPATIRMAPPPAVDAADDEDELVAMPEEGDEVEHTGVGEQVALPEGFGDDVFFAPPEELEPVPSAEPGPFERMRRGLPPPRIASEEAPEGLSLAWMGPAPGAPENVAEIVEDASLIAERNREKRQLPLNAAIFDESEQAAPAVADPPPARASRSVPPWASAQPAAEPESTAWGEPGVAVGAPLAPLRERNVRARFEPPPWAAPPASDGIPDAISALAEALERDPAPAQPEPRRLRPASGEPPRISRREREVELQAPPVPLRRRPEPTDPRSRRLARPTLPGGGDDLHDTPRRPRAALPRDPGPGADTAPVPRRSLAPVVMPTPSFAPGETAQPEAYAQDSSPLLDRASRPSPPRTAPRTPRVRAPQPRQAPRGEVSPVVAGIALLLFITGLSMLVIPRFNRRSQPVPPPPASGPVEMVAAPAPAPAPVEPPETTPPVPAPEVAAAPVPVVEPAPAPKPANPSAKSTAYTVALGVIRVTSDRKALIILDGKQQGYAPGLADIPVMPGQHKVRAVVSGTGLSRTMEIRVDAGSAVVAEFAFR